MFEVNFMCFLIKIKDEILVFTKKKFGNAVFISTL